MNSTISLKLSAALAVVAAATALNAAEVGNYFGEPLTHVPEGRRIVISQNPAKKLKLFVVVPASCSGAVTEWAERYRFDSVLMQTESFIRYSPFFPNVVKVYAPSIDEKESAAIIDERLSHLNECDAVVLAKLSPKLLPTNVCEKILGRVRDGASLLYISYGEEKNPAETLGLTNTTPLTNGPAADFPLVGKLEGVRTWRGDLGKGRAFVIDYIKPRTGMPATLIDPFAPFWADDPLYYDMYLGFVTKCLLDVTDGTKHPCARTETEFYDRDGVCVPRPAYGENMRLDRFLDADGRLCDFTMSVTNETSVRGIESIAVAPEAVKPGETFSATLTFSAPYTGKIAAMINTEPEGRVVYVNEFDVMNRKDFTFKAAVDAPDSFCGILSVSVADTGFFDEKRECVYFNIPCEHDDLEFVVWSCYNAQERLSRLFYNCLRKAGVTSAMETSIMFMGPEMKHLLPRLVKRTGLRSGYYTCRLTGPEEAHMPTTNCCLSRFEKNVTEDSGHGRDSLSARNIADYARGTANLGTLYYNLGDENGLSWGSPQDTCHCPECTVAFRKYLKKMYGSIDKLNAEYESSFKDWGEIKTLKITEACETPNLLPMWLDFRMFMEDRFIDYHHWAGGIIRKYVPDASLGIEGLPYPFSSFSGWRLYDILPYFSFYGPYPDNRDFHAVKYMQPGGTYMSWFGSYDGEVQFEAPMRSKPWQFLFKGLNTVAWYNAGGMSSRGGYSLDCGVAPDFKPLLPFSRATEEIRRIRESGIGALIVGSKTQSTKIAMHYSNNSLHAATINPDQSSWKASHEEFGIAINGTGLEYEFLSPKEMMSGELSRFKVLCLPYSQALFPAETKAIKKFVKNGGLVIADFNPGIMDEHGKLLPESSLQEVFGSFERLHVNKYGKGTAVYLDDFLVGMRARDTKGVADGVKRGFARIIEEFAGVKPFAVVTNHEGGIEGYSLFERCDLRSLCLLGPSKAARLGTGGAESQSESFGGGTTPDRMVTLQEKHHVWDPLEGYQYLGFTDSFAVELKPFVGRVFVISKDLPKQMNLSVRKDTVAPGEAFKLRIASPSAVMLLEVSGLFDGNRRIQSGSYTLNTAYNDKPGTYTAKLTDAITGAMTACKLVITGSAQ